MTKSRFILIFVVVLLCALTAMAQVQNGQFSGTVTDPSGAAVPNATITITNHATNLSVTATTNQNGAYATKELPIGTYTIKIEAAGFKTFTDVGVVLNAGTISHVDAKMVLGQAREIVEVTGQEVAVNTEDSKLASTVTSTQIANLPLNGRNVYDLMQLAPGAVNVNGTDFENGHGTVVNGLREDFNGFLINGVSNKGLSGGANNTPIQDTVEEFQQLQLNMSAQYGNSAGSTTNLVTKSGTNNYHGSVWEYLRNDRLDANNFFLNGGRVPDPRKDPNSTLCATNNSDCYHPPLRFNQFGGTFGGALIKDKLFFFASYQGDRFTTSGTPQSDTHETSQWRNAVLAADAQNGVNSVAGLLYGKFTPSAGGINPVSLDQYVPATSAAFTDPIFGIVAAGSPDYSGWLCAGGNAAGGTNSPTISTRMATVLGVTAMDQAIMRHNGCATGDIPGTVTGTADRSAPFEETGGAIFKTQTQTLGNLFNGNEASLRLDYNWNANNRTYVDFNWFKSTDQFGPCSAACDRGFGNPQKIYYPNGQISWVHTFSGRVLNEFHAGYTANKNLINTSIPGVPDVNFDDGSLGFGSYNGYPQFFKENVYSYSDMVSISHGNHSLKVGLDLRRNLENSEFNVARPSYYFIDPLYFAADAPYSIAAGVNPDICTAPCTSFNPAPNSFLQSNVRHWRNLEMGAYFQDDWKVSKRLTLNLGIRYDLFTRHNELNNLATTFIPGPGSNVVQGVANANVPAGSTGTIGGVNYDCTSDTSIALSTLAGVCGPGGFAAAKSLGRGDHNDWGPRVGFAWDVFGDGKTSMRGGFGISYEGTLYNPLSNSRWNLPYYSFNGLTNFIEGDTSTVVYGPTTCNSSGVCTQVGGAQVSGGTAPSYTTGTNPNQGTGAQATGNIVGWDGNSPNQAQLTGIVLPEGIRDPYVYNYFYGIQREILPKTTLEINYVGTVGHKLFRAESINREPGVRLPAGASITDNFGRTWTGTGSRLNNNYGTMRNWRNLVNSNYNGLQASLRRQMGHGLLFNVNYTYSHSIDNGSTWHSGATTANGAAGGEGYSTDVTLPGLDRGDSIYDIRHRLVLNYVWQLPGKDLNGVLGAVAGGWSLNGIWALQSGAHWEPYDSRGRTLNVRLDANGVPINPDACTGVIDTANCYNTGGDYNFDRATNDRPSSSMSSFSSQSRGQWANGWCDSGSAKPENANCGAASGQPAVPVFSTPCLGCTGNLGRNTFVGPGSWVTDMTLAKTFKMGERFSMKFEAAAFNIFNRANFVLATAGGGAHNKVSDGLFGAAAGTLNPRNLQLGLKLSF